MKRKRQLPNILKHKMFSLDDARKCGVSKAQLYGLVREGVVLRVARNCYQYHGFALDSESLLAAAFASIGPPCAICLVSALEFYELTDEIPQQTWVMVSWGKISRRKDLRLSRRRNPLWSVGIVKRKNFWITSIERTLVECLYYQSILGPFVALSAIKKAIKEGKTTLANIIAIAKTLNKYRKLKPYFESLI